MILFAKRMIVHLAQFLMQTLHAIRLACFEQHGHGADDIMAPLEAAFDAEESTAGRSNLPIKLVARPCRTELETMRRAAFSILQMPLLNPVSGHGQCAATSPNVLLRQCCDQSAIVETVSTLWSWGRFFARRVRSARGLARRWGMRGREARGAHDAQH